MGKATSVSDKGTAGKRAHMCLPLCSDVMDNASFTVVNMLTLIRPPNSSPLTADDIEVTGVVRAQWRPLFPGARCDGTLSLHACHMRTVNSLHRAVAPPAEGLAEQFRCAWHLR